MNVEKNYSFSFGIIDLIVLILSCISVIADVCTDIILVAHYVCMGYKAWAVATLSLIFFPSIIVNFFSLRWHISDQSTNLRIWLYHFFLLGIFHRHIAIIKSGIKAYKNNDVSDILKVYLDQSDLCMLHLFESFLESCPQLVLQVYLVSVLDEWKLWTVVSALASLFSLAWSLAVYSKTQRQARANKNVSSWTGLLFQAVWRIGTLGARITAIVLGAYCFRNYIFLFIAFHWTIMTIWIIQQNTDFCETYWEEKIYNAVVGVIYCFCFFNLQEGRSRWRLLSFFLITGFENFSILMLFLLWIGKSSFKLMIFGILGIVGGTIIGTTSMLIYYKFNHPSGHITIYSESKKPSIKKKNLDCCSATLWSLKKMHNELKNSTSQSYLNNSLKPASPLSDSIIVIEENNDSLGEYVEIFHKPTDESEMPIEASVEQNIQKSPTETKKEYFYKRRPICSESDLVKLYESTLYAEKYKESTAKLVDSINATSKLLPLYYENLSAVKSTINPHTIEEINDHDEESSALDDIKNNQIEGYPFLFKDEKNKKYDNIDSDESILGQCASETSTDYTFRKSFIESFPIIYPLSTAECNSSEIKELSKSISPDPQTKNNRSSTLVATIEEIRFNSPLSKNCSKSRCIEPNRSCKKRNSPLKENYSCKKFFFTSQLASNKNESLSLVENHNLKNDNNENIFILKKKHSKNKDLIKPNTCHTNNNKENIPTTFNLKNSS